MKNTKKIISLVLAICMMASLAIGASAANTVDTSGGTGTSSVTLSSTADGSLGGDPAATKMSVTVPTVLPIAVGTDGSVATASDAKIVNKFGAVKVNSVSIEAAQGWNLTAFGDKATLAKEKVDSNKFGFSISLGNGAAQVTDNKNASKQTLLDAAVEGCFMSGVGDYLLPTLSASPMMQSLPRFPKPSRTRPSHLYSSLSRGMQSNRNSSKGNAQAFPLPGSIRRTSK